MSLTNSLTYREFTVRLPEELVTQMEEIALQDSRDISDLFREAFRSYQAERIRRKIAETRATVAARVRAPYTEQDVEQLIDEIRSERYEERKRSA